MAATVFIAVPNNKCRIRTLNFAEISKLAIPTKLMGFRKESFQTYEAF